VPTSTFIADDYTTSWIARGSAISGLSLDTVLELGDDSKNGGPDDRRSMVHGWDLFDPETGFSIPKICTIISVKIDWTASATQNTSIIRNREHDIALIASDGHWDRSITNALSEQGGSGITYGPPTFRNSTALQLKNSAASEIATTVDTFDAGAAVTNFLPFIRGFGCTVEVPNAEDVKSVGFVISRGVNPAPAQDVELRVKAYSLKANGRQYAIDTLIATSDPVMYSSLPFVNPPTVYETFTFSTAIPAVTTGSRWLGFMVEGEWLDDSHYTTHWLRYIGGNASLDPSVYNSGSRGSTFWASPEAAYRWENSFLWQYVYDMNVPFARDENTTLLMTIPFKRYFGSVMSQTISAGTWAIDEAASYGSTNSGADEIFPNFVANVQDWIDSDWYTPSKRETYMGIMMGNKNPENILYEMHGPGNTGGYSNIRLTIEYTIPIDSLCEFGIEASGAVAGGFISTHHAIESFNISVQSTLEDLGTEIDSVVGHYGVSATPAVVSFPITVGEC